METLLFLPGGIEIAIIAGVIILLFGARKIPGLMKGIGQGIREFKTATKPKEEIESSREEERNREEA